MKILVIGAAGKTGRLTVEGAVAAGHSVTAFVRDVKNTYPKAAGVRVIGGSATDPVSMNAAMQGQDAVIDTIGGRSPWKTTTLETDAARVIIAAMRQANAQRLIVISALGVRDSIKQSPLPFRAFILPTLLRGSTRDKTSMEHAVEASGLQYVILRPAILNDNAAKGGVMFVSGTGKAHNITRADVARFAVDQLIVNTNLGRAVTLAND